MADISFLDGGLGQELIKRSSAPPHPLWSTKVMLDEPHLVSDIHRDFCDAGARVICLNTYAVSRHRLKTFAPEYSDSRQTVESHECEIPTGFQDALLFVGALC